MQTTPLKIGISASLLGAIVRFDGGHKISHFVTNELDRYAEFDSVCPEMGMGLLVPRPTLRLISANERIALVETKDSSRDHTAALESYSQQKVAELQHAELWLHRLRKITQFWYGACQSLQAQWHRKDGVGVYTRILMVKMPWLPIEEAGRLNDPDLRKITSSELSVCMIFTPAWAMRRARKNRRISLSLQINPDGT